MGEELFLLNTESVREIVLAEESHVPDSIVVVQPIVKNSKCPLLIFMSKRGVSCDGSIKKMCDSSKMSKRELQLMDLGC